MIRRLRERWLAFLRNRNRVCTRCGGPAPYRTLDAPCYGCTDWLLASINDRIDAAIETLRLSKRFPG